MHEPSSLPLLEGPVILVPVKAFHKAKARLAPALDAQRRAELARTMAEHVLKAAAPLPVAVVCDDDAVAAWAAAKGAFVIHEPGRGLSGAVTEGVHQLRAAGAGEVMVVHGDLPFAERLAELTGFEGVTLVPDRSDDGTNVVCVPAGADFSFSYGPGSFARHVAEVQRLGLVLRIVRLAELSFDVDAPADVGVLSGGRVEP